MPSLSDSAQIVLRVGYAALLLGTIIMAVPHWGRFFVSERWGGYAQQGRFVDAIQNPLGSRILLVVWLGIGFLLLLGIGSAWVAFVNVLICRYLFVDMRWRGVLRGLGAPGFMMYWLGLAVFLLELTGAYAPGARPLALLVLQVDLACIMLSAGTYKIAAGYAQNHGLEFGLVNPEWSYWWRFYRRLPPTHWIFKTLNHLGWSTELCAGILLLIPTTQSHLFGGLLLVLSFGFVATQIRLGFLTESVALAAVVAFAPGTPADGALAGLAVWLPRSTNPGEALQATPQLAISILLATYLILLPFAHAGLAWNFYARRHLPEALQNLLERYTNFFGLIIWRVFTADLVDFVVRIYGESADGTRRLISHYGHWRDLRFTHVGELITVTSLFTTLKYYPRDASRFIERLLRYTRTLPVGTREACVFEYAVIRKEAQHFEEARVAEYIVDVRRNEVEVRRLSHAGPDSLLDVRSPIHEGWKPGSYAPRPARLG